MPSDPTAVNVPLSAPTACVGFAERSSTWKLAPDEPAFEPDPETAFVVPTRAIVSALNGAIVNPVACAEPGAETSTVDIPNCVDAT